MPDEGASMADEPKSGKDEAIRDHYDQRRPQDKPMPEFLEEERLEESQPAVEAAKNEDTQSGEGEKDEAGSIGTGTVGGTGAPGGPAGNAGSGMA